ncbi:MAG: AraC family transcriptional regulator [Paenibacillaceae bacterium]
MNPEHDYFSIGMNPSPTDGELTVLFSGEGQPQRSHGIGPAIHDYYLIHTVLGGEGVFTMCDQEYHCSLGDTFIIFPGELFTYKADSLQPWHYIWVSFVGHGAAELMQALGVSPEQPIIRASLNPKIRGYYKELQQCFMTNNPPELSNLEAGGWVRLLLQQFGLAKLKLEDVKLTLDTNIDHIIKQAVQYLTLQFTQPISIEYMSNKLGYHRAHLCKLFKQATGVSPMQYLLRIRMQRAELLLATSMTIDQVASSVGYSDALYFSRKFHKWRGQSPSAYRNTLQSFPER